MQLHGIALRAPHRSHRRGANGGDKASGRGDRLFHRQYPLDLKFGGKSEETDQTLTSNSYLNNYYTRESVDQGHTRAPRTLQGA
jgi:hypothetical protein